MIDSVGGERRREQIRIHLYYNEPGALFCAGFECFLFVLESWVAFGDADSFAVLRIEFYRPFGQPSTMPGLTGKEAAVGGTFRREDWDLSDCLS